MPMHFTDGLVNELLRERKLTPHIDETPRQALIRYAVEHNDFVEAKEIETGRPWNEFTLEDLKELISRHPSTAGVPAIYTRFKALKKREIR